MCINTGFVNIIKNIIFLIIFSLPQGPYVLQTSLHTLAGSDGADHSMRPLGAEGIPPLCWVLARLHSLPSSGAALAQVSAILCSVVLSH